MTEEVGSYKAINVCVVIEIMSELVEKGIFPCSFVLPNFLCGIS